MPETPLGIALVICDTIITDQRTNKRSLIGIFNVVASNELPIMIRELSVFAQLTNGQGDFDAMLRCTRAQDGLELMKVGGQLNFPEPNAVVELQFNLLNIQFREPGIYAFELLCNGEHVLESRFNVIYSQPKEQL